MCLWLYIYTIGKGLNEMNMSSLRESNASGVELESILLTLLR